MRPHEFNSSLLRQRQADELKVQLRRQDLTLEMVSIILATTVESCTQAYLEHDWVSGDQLAALNGVAEARARSLAG